MTNRCRTDDARPRILARVQTAGAPKKNTQAIGAIPGSERGYANVKAWIDQSQCIGNGICSEILPESIVLIDNLAYMRQNGVIFAESEGQPEGHDGIATIPAELEADLLEAADECPTECIHILT